VKPDTKYSYWISVRGSRREIGRKITERTWDIEMEKTKPISAHAELKTSGLCLPSRSSLTSRGSSTAGEAPLCGEFSFSRVPGVGDIGLATSS